MTQGKTKNQNQGGNNMEKNEIMEMISYYKMWKTPEGNVRMRDHLEEAKANIETIRAAKPAILAYWDAESKELADRQARRENKG